MSSSDRSIADLGLVTINGAGKRLGSTPSEVAVELLIRQQQERHERARADAAELTEHRRAALRLFQAGLADATIARRLGASARSAAGSAD